jgi:hypothetical protein
MILQIAGLSEIVENDDMRINRTRSLLSLRQEILFIGEQ